MIAVVLISQISVNYLFSNPNNFNNEISNKEIVSNTNFEILDKLDVYPNPADDYIYVKLEEVVEKGLKIEVMSFIGNKMNTSSEKVEKNLFKVNLRNIPSGHYYVMITHGEVKEIKKFLKQ